MKARSVRATLLTSLVVAVVIVLVMLTGRRGEGMAASEAEEGVVKPRMLAVGQGDPANGQCDPGVQEALLLQRAMQLPGPQEDEPGSMGDDVPARYPHTVWPWSEARQHLTYTYRMARGAGWQKTLDEALHTLAPPAATPEASAPE